MRVISRLLVTRSLRIQRERFLAQTGYSVMVSQRSWEDSQALKVGQNWDAEGEKRLGGQLPSCTPYVCKSVMCV